ncbi:glycosyltransferase family 9 protein [Phytohabitans sp. ZYX-F-186]|uniref:Glycosyltransferase family 9 protein n=1 Tax=Phytohabitans maris TaxID=3071409 RepID=A0ABU0ZE24_9ACTN|nr:glycosyltransferase family 9 protein [Phytohabitans sp. ZYX-F-186]MDQ7904207.1 glycosyltransferase family 9 protein [Phytohabitans sp. ZYX-F-186]
MILVLRALGIGDLATGVPALRALRRAFPDRTLALAAPAWLGPLAELVGGIDALVPCDGLDPRALPRADWAVNLHGKGPQSHRLLRRSQPARLGGFACPEAEHVDGPQWSDDEHEVRRWCRLLEWYGVPTDPTDLALHPPPAPARRGVAVVHPGAKAPERRWSPQRFAAVARDLAARGFDVAVTGSTAERPVAECVAALAGLPEEAVLAGRTDPAELAGTVGHARLVVSGDTGVAHLATAYRVPSVVLFGPVTPELWGPPPDRAEHRALWRGPTVASIGVEEVLAAVDEVTCAAAA